MLSYFDEKYIKYENKHKFKKTKKNFKKQIPQNAFLI